MIDKIISNFHNSEILGKLFHTLNYCLKKELSDCTSVLDLGCGPSSPLVICKNVKYSVGVEAFEPYLKASQSKGIHNKYILGKIEDQDFKPKEFDAVIMIEVFEHLDEVTAHKVLELATKWAKKKIIITTPNGFVDQYEIHGNKYQKHLSGWDYTKLKKLGFKIRGLAGLKFLRKGKDEKDTNDESLMVSIRFKPKAFWFTIATLSQLYTYYFPKGAFELFCVKKV